MAANNKNERPPTIGVHSAAEEHPDLDQQISKLKEDAEKRFADAQKNAQKEAEEAKRKAKIESEVEAMYGTQAASTVNESERYKASVEKSDEENALLRPKKDEITVEDAIAAYGDYIADDGYVANDHPIDESVPSVDHPYTDMTGSTLPEMPTMESMSFGHNYSYYTFGIQPASSEKQHPQGLESVGVTESTTEAGSSNANSVPFSSQFIRNEETYYDKSALGEAQADYDQKMREHPEMNGLSSIKGEEPYTHDPYFQNSLTGNTVETGSVTSFLSNEKATGSQSHDINEQHLVTPDYSAYDAYRSQQELKQETSAEFPNNQPSEDKVSYTDLSKSPEIPDRSSVGMAQREYDQRMHEKPASSNGYSGYSTPDANEQAITPENIISVGSGKYYNAKTNDLVYKNGNGSFVEGSKAVELGIVSQEQYENDRVSENFRYNSSQSHDNDASYITHSERPLVNTETEGVLTDGSGRFYSSETRDVLYKANDGNYYNSEKAIEKGIITQAQVDLEHGNDFSPSRKGSPPVITNDGGIYTHQAQVFQENKGRYDRSGVGIAQQEYEQRLSYKPGYNSDQDKNLSDFSGLTKGQEYNGQQGYIVTDGNGHYYDHATKEVVYKGTDGAFHNTDEAIQIGLVTKEEAARNQLNHQSYFESTTKSSAQLFNGTNERAHSNFVGDQSHYNSVPELYKTENNDVLTDGRGRFYNSETKEVVYKSTDNQYINAEKAIKAGIITNEQADADRFDNMAKFARVIDRESPSGNNTEINRTASDFERRSSHSGLDVAQHEYEQRMAEKPAGRSLGSPIAPQHINSEPPVLTRTNTDGVLTDGAGRFYKADTKEILYKGNDGNYFNAENAIELGLTSKEQVAADQSNNKFFSGFSSDKFVQNEYNTGIPAVNSKIQDIERSGLGMAQQEFEYRMSEKPGKSNNSEPFFAGQYIYRPDAELRAYTDGILTDESGHFYRSDTREIVYKSTDGQFLNAERAVELGIITREQASADQLRALNSSSHTNGIDMDQSRASFRSSAGTFDEHSGLNIAQQEYEQRLSEKPGRMSNTLEHTDAFTGYTVQSDHFLKKTQTDGILTDGNGRFYKSDTNELVYKGADGNYLEAEKAIELGVVSRSQVEADLAVRVNGKQLNNLQYTSTGPNEVIATKQGAFYDSKAHVRLYKNNDGNFVTAKDAIKLGLIDENKARFDIAEDSRYGNMNLLYQYENQKFNFIDSADSLKDKAKLVGLRKEIGFGPNISGFVTDDSYNSMHKFVERDRHYYLSEDATFAQSRLFQQKISQGLNPEGAYDQSKQLIIQMSKEGHTSESIVASLNPAIKKEDIEFLKRNGNSVIQKNESTFAFGQRYGKKAATGAVINTEAEKIAFRITDRNGRPISDQSINRFKITPDKKTNLGTSSGKANYDITDDLFINFEVDQPLESKTDKKSKSTGKGIDPHEIDLFDDIDAPSNKIMKDGDKGKKIDAGVDDGNTEIGVVRHNLYHPSGRTAAIARGSKSIMIGVGMMGMNIFYSAAGESASGLRKTQDYIDVAKLTVGMTAVNTARRIINRPNAFELTGLLKANGAATLLAYKQSLNKRFAKVGIKPFSTGLSGTALVIAAQKQMLAIKTEMARKGQTAALKEAYAVAKAFRKIGLLTVYAKTPHKIKLSRRIFRLSGLCFRMLMTSGGDAYRGIDTVMRYSKNAMMAGKAFLFATKHGAKIGIYALGGIINQSGRIATKAGNAIVKAAAKTGGKGAVLATGKVLQKYGRGVKKVSTAKRRIGKKISHIRRDVKDFLKDPFGLKRKMRQQINAILAKAWAKMTAKFAWLNKVSKGAKFISHIASVISTVVSAITQVIFFLFGIFILLIAILLILNMTIPIIISLFNFGSYDETVQDIIVQQLKDCYEEDAQKMLDISGDYNTATIDYDDTFRDLDKYTEHKAEADAASFNQSTNCAEIIAMTLVRFEYDVDDAAGTGDSEASKRELQKYVKELYYGSHELYVDVTATTYQVDTGRTDSDGNPIYETKVKRDAALTYRTYYFEYMFDESTVTLGRSETPVIYTGDVEGGSGSAVYGSVTSWDDMYVNMRQNGFTHEGACGMMANLAYETAGGQAWWTEADIRRNFINTTLVSSDGYDSYGIVQWTGGRKTNLINWCLENGYDHTTIAGQLAFMYYEMRTSYSGTYNYLRASGNSAYNCGRYVADHYEVCAEQYRPGRATLAETFANMYAAYKDDYSDLVKAGDAIVQYALQYVGRIHYTQGWGSYVGTRYLGPDLDSAVYSGGTPTIGTDCTGFVYSVYKHFGITVPTYTGAYTSSHKISLSEIQPGDILWRSTHAAIYIGNGQIVQASSCYGGNHSRDLNVSTYNASSWTCAYRYWD